MKSSDPNLLQKIFYGMLTEDNLKRDMAKTNYLNVRDRKNKKKNFKK